MIKANCDNCGKSWQVPQAKKSYSCKECGGTVCSGIACRKCKTINESDSSFCEHCGEALGEHSGESTSGQESEVDLRLAKIELGHLKKSISAVRILFIVYTVGTGIILALCALVALAFPGPEALILLGVSAGIFATALLGAFRVSNEPFFWSIALAAFSTIFAIMIMVSGALISFIGFISITSTLGLWVCVSRAARIQKLLNEHPDLTLDKRGRVSHAPQSTGRPTED